MIGRQTVRVQEDIQTARSGLDSCRRILSTIRSSIDDDIRRAPEETEECRKAVAMAMAVAVATMVSSLAFASAAMQGVHGGADAIIAATNAGRATPDLQRRLAALMSEEFGPAMPWFGMRAARFHVRADSIMTGTRMLLESLAKLSVAQEEMTDRKSNGKCRTGADAMAFVHEVDKLVAEVSSRVDKTLLLLPFLEDDAREIRAVIDVEKSRLVAGCCGELESSEPLGPSLLLLIEISRVAHAVVRSLAGLWEPIRQHSSQLRHFAERMETDRG